MIISYDSPFHVTHEKNIADTMSTVTDNMNKDIQILNDAEQYIGQYVTIKDYGNKEILSNAETAIDAYKGAINQGYENPVLLYIGDSSFYNLICRGTKQ